MDHSFTRKPIVQYHSAPPFTDHCLAAHQLGLPASPSGRLLRIIALASPHQCNTRRPPCAAKCAQLFPFQHQHTPHATPHTPLHVRFKAATCHHRLEQRHHEAASSNPAHKPDRDDAIEVITSLLFCRKNPIYSLACPQIIPLSRNWLSYTL